MDAWSTHTVEEVALAVGEVIGHGSIKSVAQINGEVVLFCRESEAGQSPNGGRAQCYRSV